MSGRVLRSEGNSGVVTGTPIRSPLPPRCLIPPVCPSEPPANAPAVVPPECPLSTPHSIPVVDSTPRAENIQCNPGSTVAQIPTQIAPTPPVSRNAGPSHVVDSTPRAEPILGSPASNVAQNSLPNATTPPVSGNAGPSMHQVDARRTSTTRPQPTTSLSYLLSFMPDHEKRKFLSKHPKARLSISSSPVPIESHGAADSHYSANTKSVEDVQIVSSIPPAHPGRDVEFPCSSQPQAGGPSLQAEGEKECNPNSRSQNDVQIVYSTPPAPPVPDVEFPCGSQPEAGGPSLQVEGEKELIHPSTSKAPVRYKMKALREKKKKKKHKKKGGSPKGLPSISEGDLGDNCGADNPEPHLAEDLTRLQEEAGIQSCHHTDAPGPSGRPMPSSSPVFNLAKPRRKHRRTRAHPNQSSGGSTAAASQSVSEHTKRSEDSVTPATWGTAGEIPPFEVNTLAAPTGDFADHMKQYAFDQGSKEFPWHVNWNRQCPELKARFTMRLRKVYPGPWESKTILTAVGANLRERRCRLKKKFETYKNWRTVPRPTGCTAYSFQKIYELTKDAKINRKAELCRSAANKRMKEVGYSHKCGPTGLKGLSDRFVSVFFNVFNVFVFSLFLVHWFL